MKLAIEKWNEMKSTPLLFLQLTRPSGNPSPLPQWLPYFSLTDSFVDAGASSFATCLLPSNAFGFLRFYKWNLIAKNNKKTKRKKKNEEQGGRREKKSQETKEKQKQKTLATFNSFALLSPTAVISKWINK